MKKIICCSLSVFAVSILSGYNVYAEEPPVFELCTPVFTISDMEVTNQQRINRTTYEYTLQASITNTGDPAYNVVIGFTTPWRFTYFTDPEMSFGDVDSGASVESTDTVTLRLDSENRDNFDESLFGFRVSYSCQPDPIISPCDRNVAEASDYRLVYELPIPDGDRCYDAAADDPPPYSVDNTADIMGFDRVAYCMQLDDQWIWVSMDAFTDDPTKLGVPTRATGEGFQQIVSNMNVASNVPDIVQGEGITTGNIEFWPHDFGKGNAIGIPGASDDTWDFGDEALPDSSYGSMQVHNYGAQQTLFAYNGWNHAPGDIPNPDGNDDLGIGNRPNPYAPDWRWVANSGNYAVKNLFILVREQ